MMKLEHAQERAEALETENASLKTELDRQQIMFKELKKMRGRGDEFELLKATQAVLYCNASVNQLLLGYI